MKQRRIYAGTNNLPSTVFASRIGDAESFYTSEGQTAEDPFILSISSTESTPIKFLLENPRGFFAFSASGVVRVVGDQDGVLSGSTAQAVVQTAEGCGDVPPIHLDQEYLYVTSTYDSVVSLQPGNLPNYYVTFDFSLLSNHYFSPANNITGWAWSKAPHNLLWATRKDGTMLSCVYDPTQKVYAWSDHTTAGDFKHVASLYEDGYDRVYLIVSREVNGKTMQYIERQTLRYTDTVDEMWAVDSGLATTLTKPAATLKPSAYTGTITITAGASVFSSGDVGKVLRVGGGRGTVATYVSATQLTVTLDRDIIQVSPERTTPPTFASGEWSLDAKVSSVSGLWHLEGETVEVLGDGKVLSNATVSGGSITLSAASSYVVAGLPYTAHLKTLPLAVSDAPIEAEQKRPAAVSVRLWNSREVLVGQGDKFYPLVDQRTTAYSAGTGFQNGLISKHITAAFDHEGAIEFKKSGPLHTTILGYVAEYEVGST